MPNGKNVLASLVGQDWSKSASADMFASILSL